VKAIEVLFDHAWEIFDVAVAGIIDEFLIRGDPPREIQRHQRITRIKSSPCRL
jgi:hypothetical protein